MARTSNNRVITACDLYCCLLPQCEALRTCRSGFSNATVWYNKIFALWLSSDSAFTICHALLAGNVAWKHVMYHFADKLATAYSTYCGWLRRPKNSAHENILRCPNLRAPKIRNLLLQQCFTRPLVRRRLSEEPASLCLLAESKKRWTAAPDSEHFRNSTVQTQLSKTQLSKRNSTVQTIYNTPSMTGTFLRHSFANRAVVTQFLVAGVIDFGDMMESKYVFEVATLMAYVMIKTWKDNLNVHEAARCSLKGYESVLPLLPDEKNVLFLSVTMRFVQILCIDSRSAKEQPDNATYIAQDLEACCALLPSLLSLGCSGAWRVWA